MRRTFNYNGEVIFSEEFDVDSVGNVCLHAIDSIGANYFLYIKTTLGITECLEFGPILILEDETLEDTYSIVCSRFEYSDASCVKKIQSFLRPRPSLMNKRKKVQITHVETIDIFEALSYGINPFKIYLEDLEQNG